MRILRYEVPVDDGIHELPAGRIVHVTTRSASVVEVWAEENDDDLIFRRFTVVGTGHLWDENNWVYRGTAVVPGGIPGAGLVWHLLEKS